MNEKIKELAVKAQVEHCISHVRLQEFAELIIQECMTQCEQVAADADAMTKSEFVTAAQPISAGIHPAAPPQTIFCGVRFFSKIV